MARFITSLIPAPALAQILEYLPGFDTVIEQTVAVLDVVRTRTEMDKRSAVVVGQSFGGTTAIKEAAVKRARVQAAIISAGQWWQHCGTTTESLFTHRSAAPFSSTTESRRESLRSRLTERTTCALEQRCPRTGSMDSGPEGSGALAVFPVVGDNGQRLLWRALHL